MLPINIKQTMNEVQDQLNFKFREEKFLLFTFTGFGIVFGCSTSLGRSEINKKSARKTIIANFQFLSVVKRRTPQSTLSLLDCFAEVTSASEACESDVEL